VGNGVASCSTGVLGLDSRVGMWALTVVWFSRLKYGRP
jgi:hypothetical protein